MPCGWIKRRAKAEAGGAKVRAYKGLLELTELRLGSPYLRVNFRFRDKGTQPGMAALVLQPLSENLHPEMRPDPSNTG